MQNVLMVDDDQQVAGVLAAALRTMGHEVTVESDSANVEAVCREMTPDVVLLDLMMPGRTGLELVGPVSEICPDAVISMVTGMSDPEVASRSLETGAWSVLYKPYSLRDLAELLGLAGLLGESIRLEQSADANPEQVNLSFRGDQRCEAADVARLMSFARQAGAAPDTRRRRVPLVAWELLENARTHGAGECEAQTYSLSMEHDADSLTMTVSNAGPEFDWQTAIRRLNSMGSSTRPRGLWLVNELTQSLTYEDRGRVARARIEKNPKATA